MIYTIHQNMKGSSKPCALKQHKRAHDGSEILRVNCTQFMRKLHSVIEHVFTQNTSVYVDTVSLYTTNVQS